MKKFILFLPYLLALLYFVLSFFLMYVKWKAHSPSLDYHAYIQMFWNTTQGDVLMYNRLSEGQYSLYHAHFSPFLLMIYPIYHFIRHPLTLYFLFVAALSLSVVPLYKFSTEKLKSNLSALLVCIAFLIYFPFTFTHRHGFSEEAFSIPFLFLAFYAVYKNNSWLYLLASFLTLSLKINMALPVLLLGIYAIVRSKIKVQGFFICCLSVFWLWFIVDVVFPKYNTSSTPLYVAGFFHEYGDSVGEIAKNLLLNPLKIVEVIQRETKIAYVRDLFGPVLFLPLLALDILWIGMPILMLNILSNYERMSQSWTYYHSSSLPFIWLAVVVSLSRIGGVFHRSLLKGIVVNGILLSIIIWNIVLTTFTPHGQYLPWSAGFNKKLYEVTVRDSVADQITDAIPSTISLATQVGYFEHTSERKWHFPVATYQNYLPDLVFYDSLAQTRDVLPVQREGSYTLISSSSAFFLYSRSDVTSRYSKSEFLSQGKNNHDQHLEYMAVFVPHGSGTHYSDVHLTIPIEINERYALAQRLILGQNPAYLEIPVEKVNTTIPSKTFGYMVQKKKEGIGHLRVEILEGEEIVRGATRLLQKQYEFPELPYKTSFISIDLHALKLSPEKTYWVKLSMDRERASPEEVFNKYNVYLTAKQADRISGSFHYSLDVGKTWMIDAYPQQELFYGVAHKKEKIQYPHDALNDGSIIRKGTIQDISTLWQSLPSDYDNVIIVGSIREQL